MKVLVIEDDQDLRHTLATCMQGEGYTLEAVADGESGLRLAREQLFDIAVIDLGLPNLSGIEVIRALRRDNQLLPILILTGRGRWKDKVEGLENGADDYLVKPFHTEELLARMKALVRRSSAWSNVEIKCGPINLNTAQQTVQINNTAITLTQSEYRIIEHLMTHAGKIISKADLTEYVYNQDFDKDSNVIEVFIARLRKKLDPESAINPIETLRGRGYRFTLQRE
ncbi:MAG: response regulator transcription factor [Gammaproteobacteria bacterium]|nr:response regulator transcription factor [Gammaproteobacteria bacterium]